MRLHPHKLVYLVLLKTNNASFKKCSNRHLKTQNGASWRKSATCAWK
jgi:hypothetical protein